MHIPVLLKEVTDNLIHKDDGIYIDATLGFGGHSKAILSSLGRGKLLGIDRDIEALSQVHIDDNRFEKMKANFTSIDVAAHIWGVEKVDGILADIGVSSYQIDSNDRGFSYIGDGPLDMRMDKSMDKSALDVVNSYSEEDIANVIYNFGEERRSRRIAKLIVKRRSSSVIRTTSELFGIVMSASSSGLSSVKRVFQAIRIEVNNEIDNLKIMLDKASNLLSTGGRISIITFHSLEDRIVKSYFRESKFLEPLFKKAIVPSGEEVEQNSRSKPAKLRVAYKLPVNQY
ncbi:MAG TPA: 16S rRNA (cytosine(1402)-N(4))-methyltransferase [Fusobacteria bacterium]|nr:16S rRNA (cytosine(1402)-N(4))-methyltransferase [Fusobacteriota bacterium]|tara:strand:- start:7341 stop:8198 length:858 start_codon:yes stop_codon:yes gene_type:complete